MAGHSKWANIKHRKAKQDSKKGKLYTKLIREITISAKLGGADPDANPRLRAAWDKALVANMAKDVIDRAIKRGAGGLEGADVEEVRYEGYAPGGVAVMIECMTNNRNRTVAEIRHAFSKCGGNMGTDGSVAYLFNKRGQITLAPGSEEASVMDVAIEAGADDVIIHDDNSIDITTSADNFIPVKNALTQAGIIPVEAEVTLAADVSIPISDKEIAEKIIQLTDMLEDLDDVQEVYTNADITDEVMEKLDF
ncbi:MAG: YebC/PmpR family DNA-binding transcriptional regulator [Pseudomonadota bacterium]